MQQAHDLRKACREVESKLIQAIQAGTVTTQISATDFIRANPEGFFPAAKFIAQLKDNLVITTYDGEGTPTFTPATWVEVKTAAQNEEA